MIFNVGKLMGIIRSGFGTTFATLKIMLTILVFRFDWPNGVKNAGFRVKAKAKTRIESSRTEKCSNLESRCTQLLFNA